MKTIIAFFMILSSATVFAADKGSCVAESTAAAYDVIGDPEQEAFVVYETKFLGQLELPDLLDGDESAFFEAYYYVLSADNDTMGVMVATGKDCSIVSKKVLGRE